MQIPAGETLRIEGPSATSDPEADYFSFGGSGSFGIDSPCVANGRFVILNSGNVGIGTTAPGSILELQSNAQGNMGPSLSLTNSGGGYNSAASIDFNTFTPFYGGSYNPSSRIIAVDNGDWSNTIIFLFNRAGGPNKTMAEAMRVSADGVTVTGNVTVNGNATVTGDIFLTGADCAEQFDVIGAKLVSPGTVVVIDTEGALRESDKAYDKRVAGVVSGGGSFRHAIVLDRQSSEESRIALALMGKVYCKVDAEYSPIEVGDLLTTSKTRGHAMKADDRERAFGSVMGKDLRPLVKGRGMIPILVALQ